MIFRKIVAFLKKDFYLEVSYRFHFLLHLAGIFFFLVTFYYISRLFGHITIPYLQSYGGDYFAFVLIGIAFAGYSEIGLASFSQNLRQEQLMGTLEAMLVTPTSVGLIVLASSFWNFLSTSIEILLYLGLGVFIFGVEMRPDLLAATVIVILTLTSLVGLGIISASFILVFKRGDPLNWLMTNLFNLLGGVYFPITVLPEWLRKLSDCLPLSYSLHSLRLALLQGYSLKQLLPDVKILILFSLILLPLGFVVFAYAVKKAKINGSLAHY